MKTNLKLLAFLCICITISNKTFSQWGMGKPEEIEDASGRKLMVIIQNENQKVIDKLNKKKLADMIPAYKQAVSDYNDQLKAAVENYFPDKSGDITYKTYDEARELDKAKNKSYAVLWVLNAELLNSGSIDVDPNLDWSYRDAKKGELDQDEKASLNKSTFLRLSLIEELTKIPIAQIGMPNLFPNKSDLTFAMEYMDWYMDNRAAGGKTGDIREMIKTNASQIPNLTLAIREVDFSEKFDTKKIKQYYKYPYQIYSSDDFDNVIMQKSDGYAYIIVVPTMTSSTIYYTPIVMNAKTGEVLSVIEPGGGDQAGSYLLKAVGNQVGVGVRTSIGKSVIDEKVFQSIVKDITSAKTNK